MTHVQWIVHVLVQKFGKPGEAPGLPSELQHLDCQTQPPKQKNLGLLCKIQPMEFCLTINKK